MQIHPLLKLALAKPHLLGEHVEAYAALAGEEIKKASSAWALRIGLFAGAGILAILGLVWGGVALLISAAVPSDGYPAGWALWVLPLTPIAIAVVLALVGRSTTMERPLDVLKQQLGDDMAVIREASSA